MTSESSSHDRQPPRLRASDHDRSRVLDYLAHAYADGRLDYSEFDERSSAASTSRFMDELSPLLEDLGGTPELPAASPSHALSPRPDSAQYATEQWAPRPEQQRAIARITRRVVGGTGSKYSLSLFGANSFSGGSTLATRHDAIVLFSGTSLDLRHTQLESKNITITLNVMFGGCDIIVPEGMRVIMNPVTLFGDSTIKVKDGVRVDPSELPSSAPSVTINGFVLFSGCDVIIAPDKYAQP
ncbi:DUF1707 domain-containing protein [Corynebacterium sp. TAE3-ERU30]|uniref:DUF1707 SHOCT-like domain-containing protein n=1 Tax=Corynebacterium sp. TAE3-ERU30 TaxID=2849496 RepID=UPI001C461A56|nr:DUF1707 domain-containing protein [Corynebacterium sp. TAE3-ERU30]MBV7281354.1 DUF1707 domain-containing protein [Corynebacterium sp. TAE3-ERU30]